MKITPSMVKFAGGIGISAMFLLGAGIAAKNIIRKDELRRKLTNPLTIQNSPGTGVGYFVYTNSSTYNPLTRSTVGLTNSLYSLRHRGWLNK